MCKNRIVEIKWKVSVTVTRERYICVVWVLGGMKEVVRDDVVVCRDECMTALEEVLQTEIDRID